MKTLDKLEGIEKQKRIEQQILVLKDRIKDNPDIISINMWTNKLNDKINQLENLK
jgi:hypothetical protein